MSDLLRLLIETSVNIKSMFVNKKLTIPRDKSLTHDHLKSNSFFKNNMVILFFYQTSQTLLSDLPLNQYTINKIYEPKRSNKLIGVCMHIGYFKIMVSIY